MLNSYLPYIYFSGIILFMAAFYQNKILEKILEGKTYKQLTRRDLLKAQAHLARKEDDVANFKLNALFWIFVVISILYATLLQPPHKEMLFVFAIFLAITRVYMDWKLIAKVTYEMEPKINDLKKAKEIARQEDPDFETSIIRQEYQIAVDKDREIITIPFDDKKNEEEVMNIFSKKTKKRFKKANLSKMPFYKHFDFPTFEVSYIKDEDDNIYRIDKEGDNLIANPIALSPTKNFIILGTPFDLEKEYIITYAEAVAMIALLVFSSLK